MYCVVRDVSTIWRGNTFFGYPVTKQCDSWKKRVVDTSCGFSLVECGELEYKMFHTVECSMWQGGVVGDVSIVPPHIKLSPLPAHSPCHLACWLFSTTFSHSSFHIWSNQTFDPLSCETFSLFLLHSFPNLRPIPKRRGGWGEF